MHRRAHVCWLRMLYRLRARSQRWRHYPRALIAEDQWRAQRYGIDPGLVDFGRSVVVHYPELLEEMIELSAEDAEALDCTAEIERARRIIERGTSAHWQVRAGSTHGRFATPECTIDEDHMTADTPQRAIFDESARYHRFLEYRIDGEPRAGRAAAAVASALTAARNSVDRPARVVVAFGRRLWSALAPDAVPSDLRDFETIDGVDGHVAPATQCDLWIWLQGDGEDENVARTLALHPALRDDFVLVLEQPGFTYFQSRDLIDFEDGTANPKDDDARTEAAVVPDGPGAGGSIVLVQRWVHDLDKFAALDVAAQEAVIGRTKAGSIELEGDDMPPDSHVSRTDVKKDGVALKVYRRSAPYATLARHGLYFLAFARARERHQIQLERMFGVAGDGLHDRLIEFSRADTGSYLLAPGERALAEAIGS